MILLFRPCVFTAIIIILMASTSKVQIVFSNATLFVYSSSLKGYTMAVSPSVVRRSTGRFDVDIMLHLTLTRSWCATWLALTRMEDWMWLGHFRASL